MTEEMIWKAGFPVGEYQDWLLDPDGEVIWTTPWQRNLIVAGLPKLLAALLKGDAQGKPLSYWAVGNGEESWDSGALPDDSARERWEFLKAEVARKDISGQIKFLGGNFTNQLEISITFTANDVGPDKQKWRLREFGLFAGGSAALNTGTMINHRIHPRIDLEPGFTLQRKLRLTF